MPYFPLKGPKEFKDEKIQDVRRLTWPQEGKDTHQRDFSFCFCCFTKDKERREQIKIRKTTNWVRVTTEKRKKRKHHLCREEYFDCPIATRRKEDECKISRWEEWVEVKWGPFFLMTSTSFVKKAKSLLRVKKEVEQIRSLISGEKIVYIVFTSSPSIHFPNNIVFYRESPPPPQFMDLTWNWPLSPLLCLSISINVMHPLIMEIYAEKRVLGYVYSC